MVTLPRFPDQPRPSCTRARRAPHLCQVKPARAPLRFLVKLARAPLRFPVKQQKALHQFLAVLLHRPAACLVWPMVCSVVGSDGRFAYVYDPASASKASASLSSGASSLSSSLSSVLSRASSTGKHQAAMTLYFADAFRDQRLANFHLHRA